MSFPVQGAFHGFQPGSVAMATGLPMLVWQLGTRTWVNPQGLIMVNKPLIEQIVTYREQAVPLLMRFLDQTLKAPYPNRNAIIEALYTGQRLAEANVSNIKQFYGITSRLNTSLDPIVLTYLGGLYEKMNETESFGPTLSALMNMAVTRYPQYNPAQPIQVDAPESLGGAVLEMLARKTAAETVAALKHELRSDLFQNTSGNA